MSRGLGDVYKRQKNTTVSYVHAGGKIGVLVNLAVEGGIDATTIGKDVAMQIAALNPRFWDKSLVTEDVIAEEKKVLVAQMDNDPKMATKPQQVKEKIAAGKLNKFYEENCLLQQDFVKDGDVTVEKYLANVEVALNEVKNADKLREDAQKALESNDVLEFKSRVGIKLTTEEQEDYTSNIETFVKSKIEELESRTFAAHIHVQTYLGGTEEGQTLAQNIEKWATADYVELDGLSSQLSQKVSEALKDGIIDADEEGAISALQEKMNSITARWKESEAQAKWDWINQEYGSLNAADLESGSFTDLLGAMRDQRQSAKESVQADVEQWYSELNSMESAGRITTAQNKQYHEMTGWYVKGQEGNELSKSLQLGSNTLNSSYCLLYTSDAADE